MKLEEIRKELKHLHENNLSILDLMIYDEIDCQLEEKLTDDEFINLMVYVENAYIKAENIDLYCIVKYCIEHRDELENMSTWDIIDNSYSYC